MGTKAHFRTRRPHIHILGDFTAVGQSSAPPPQFLQALGNSRLHRGLVQTGILEKARKGAGFWVWVDLEWR